MKIFKNVAICSFLASAKKYDRSKFKAVQANDLIKNVEAFSWGVSNSEMKKVTLFRGSILFLSEFETPKIERFKLHLIM